MVQFDMVDAAADGAGRVVKAMAGIRETGSSAPMQGQIISPGIHNVSSTNA